MLQQFENCTITKVMPSCVQTTQMGEMFLFRRDWSEQDLVEQIEKFYYFLNNLCRCNNVFLYGELKCFKSSHKCSTWMSQTTELFVRGVQVEGDVKECFILGWNVFYLSKSLEKHNHLNLRERNWSESLRTTGSWVQTGFSFLTVQGYVHNTFSPWLNKKDKIIL